MKKALVATNEKVYKYDGSLLGDRVVQVELSENTFETAYTLTWIDCPDDVIADHFYWNGSSFIAIPEPPPPVVPEAQQPNTIVTGQGGPNVVA